MIVAWLNEICFRVLWFFGFPLLKVYFRLSSENKPKIRGAYILAANHVSLLDGVVVQGVYWRRVSFFLTILFYRVAWTRWFFRMIHVIPIYDGGGNKDAMKEASERLRDGEIVAIFPEGGLSPDGKLRTGKPGVAVLSESSQLPVIPVAIVGSFEAMPRGSAFPKPKKIRIRFGEPIPPLAPAEGPRRDRYREYTQKVMDQIAVLQFSAN